MFKNQCIDTFLSKFLDNFQQGHIDFPLTPEGRETASALGALIGQKSFHVVMSSDLGRAYSTLQLASENFALPISTDIRQTDLLREVSYGLCEGLSLDLSFEEIRELRAKERNVEVHEVVDDRESLGSVLERQDRLLDIIASELHELKGVDELNVLCVSHGGFIKRFLEQKCGVRLAKKIQNCSTSIIRVSREHDGTFQFSVKPEHVNIPYDSSEIPL